MAKFIRSVIQQDVALAASTTLDPIVMPVNPLSFLLFTIRGLNNTGTITDYRFLASLLNFVSSLELRFKGQNILSGSMQDLAILNAILTGFRPVQLEPTDTDNNIRGVTFLLSLSRVPFWREEAFPAVRSGELTLHITSGAAQTGLDGVTIQVETCELLGANPSRFLKYTTLSKTFAATGDNDIDLPIGNPILGLLLFGATVPSAASFNATFGQVKVLIDNVEEDYTTTNWETLHGELGRKLMGVLDWSMHIHAVNAAGAGQEDTRQTSGLDQVLNNHAYLDYDPLKDGSYALETAGKSRVIVRANADAANAARVLPVELFVVQQLAGTRPGGAR